MGVLAGNAVRFGKSHDIMAVGEGVETVLALRTLMPSMPMAAALSAQNVSALRLPATLKRLTIAADRDRAGMRAAECLHWRAVDRGVNAVILLPVHNDFNDDLRIWTARR
ncbi:MAG: toprim domain-containing protein [Parvularculaceae bacterium]